MPPLEEGSLFILSSFDLSVTEVCLAYKAFIEWALNKCLLREWISNENLKSSMLEYIYLG